MTTRRVTLLLKKKRTLLICRQKNFISSVDEVSAEPPLKLLAAAEKAYLWYEERGEQWVTEGKARIEAEKAEQERLIAEERLAEAERIEREVKQAEAERVERERLAALTPFQRFQEKRARALKRQEWVDALEEKQQLEREAGFRPEKEDWEYDAEAYRRAREVDEKMMSAIEPADNGEDVEEGETNGGAKTAGGLTDEEGIAKAEKDADAADRARSGKATRLAAAANEEARVASLLESDDPGHDDDGEIEVVDNEAGRAIYDKEGKKVGVTSGRVEEELRGAQNSAGGSQGGRKRKNAPSRARRAEPVSPHFQYSLCTIQSDSAAGRTKSLAVTVW